jgi:hypothetical protein
VIFLKKNLEKGEKTENEVSECCNFVGDKASESERDTFYGWSRCAPRVTQKFSKGPADALQGSQQCSPRGMEMIFMGV